MLERRDHPTQLPNKATGDRAIRQSSTAYPVEYWLATALTTTVQS
jgi:hypothetical protein